MAKSATLEQDLIFAVDQFMALHSKWGSTTCMMKEASDILTRINEIRFEMRADELPDYDDPITESFAGASVPVSPNPTV